MKLIRFEEYARLQNSLGNRVQLPASATCKFCGHEVHPARISRIDADTKEFVCASCRITRVWCQKWLEDFTSDIKDAQTKRFLRDALIRYLMEDCSDLSRDEAEAEVDIFFAKGDTNGKENG